MSTHVDCLIVDAGRPAELSRFWSRLLGWPVAFESPDEVVVAPPEGTAGLPLLFGQVADEKSGKNRVHLDLASPDPGGQDAIVRRAAEMGAGPADVGQGEVPWVVLADPEGNEFCVLEARAVYAGAGAVAAIVIDATDPPAQARFWSAATGWEVHAAEAGFASLRPPSGAGPWLEFVAVPDRKRGKNRLHIDVAPYPDGDQAAEVARLSAAGAIPADVGQRDVRWVVLADPEGNEFCVLTPR